MKLNHATTGYGLLTKGCKGLRLDYYVPPFDLLDDAPKKSILLSILFHYSYYYVSLLVFINDY